MINFIVKKKKKEEVGKREKGSKWECERERESEK